MPERVTVLGSTGSVGRNVIDVVRQHADRFEIVGLAAGANVAELGQQATTHPQARLALGDDKARASLVAVDASLSERIVGIGAAGLTELIDATAPDVVVNCLVGFVGLLPTLHALKAGVRVAVANKEAIVTGGELLRDASRATGASIIPIDSEHVAIEQCLRSCRIEEVKMVHITSSGGALRDRPLEALDDVPLEEVLDHPTWQMGDKITVDSATLVNKGLEVIEAHWLFDLPFAKINVVIHPQSIVHAMVELCDNSIIAQMALPDMRLPIQYALAYPKRIETNVAKSRVVDFPKLEFREVERTRYPCFDLALRAAQDGGNMPTVLNSANEIAVGAYLAGELRFGEIRSVIATALDGIPRSEVRSFDDVAETHASTRAYVKRKFGI